jgi:hypothetical protein
MSMKTLKLIIAGLVCVATASSVRAGEILVNGGFENEPEASNPSSPPQEGGFLLLTGNEVPGWTIAANHFATMHENPGPWPTISGAYSLNTDGEGTDGNNVDIYQDFATTHGGTYNFSFDWETWQQDALSTFLHVSVEDTTSDTFLYNGLLSPLAPSQVVQHVSTSFLGDGDTYRLEIQETPQSGFNDNEYVADNFSVTTTGAVPDATTWAAEGIAAMTLVAIGFGMRRSTAISG